MNKKIAWAVLAATTLVVGPAIAEGEAATTTTTTTTTATAGEAKGGGEAGGEKEFGNPGVLSISGAVPFATAGSEGMKVGHAPTGLEIDFGSDKPAESGLDSGSHTAFAIAPTVDYFVSEGISIGAFVGFGMESVTPPHATAAKADAYKTTTLGVGPRVGYNLWLTPGKLSLWPNVWFGYFSASAKVGDADAGNASKMSLGLNVPLLIHPASHFHFGVGPFFMMDVASKAALLDPVTGKVGDSKDSTKSMTFGLSAEIGGWL